MRVPLCPHRVTAVTLETPQEARARSRARLEQGVLRVPLRPLGAPLGRQGLDGQGLDPASLPRLRVGVIRPGLSPWCDQAGGLEVAQAGRESGYGETTWCPWLVVRGGVPRSCHLRRAGLQVMRWASGGWRVIQTGLGVSRAGGGFLPPEGGGEALAFEQEVDSLFAWPGEQCVWAWEMAAEGRVWQINADFTFFGTACFGGGRVVAVQGGGTPEALVELDAHGARVVATPTDFTPWAAGGWAALLAQGGDCPLACAGGSHVVADSGADAGGARVAPVAWPGQDVGDGPLVWQFDADARRTLTACVRLGQIVSVDYPNDAADVDLRVEGPGDLGQQDQWLRLLGVPVRYRCDNRPDFTGGAWPFHEGDAVLCLQTGGGQQPRPTDVVVVGFADAPALRRCGEYLEVTAQCGRAGPRFSVLYDVRGGGAARVPRGDGTWIEGGPVWWTELDHWRSQARPAPLLGHMDNASSNGERLGDTEAISEWRHDRPLGRLVSGLGCTPPMVDETGGSCGDCTQLVHTPNAHAGENRLLYWTSAGCGMLSRRTQQIWEEDIPWFTMPAGGSGTPSPPSLRCAWLREGASAPAWTAAIQVSREYRGYYDNYFESPDDALIFEETQRDMIMLPHGAFVIWSDLSRYSGDRVLSPGWEWVVRSRDASVTAVGARSERTHVIVYAALAWPWSIFRHASDAVLWADEPEVFVSCGVDQSDRVPPQVWPEMDPFSVNAAPALDSLVAACVRRAAHHDYQRFQGGELSLTCTLYQW